MPSAPPGKGLFGWLGRQIGHVAKAVNTEVPAPLPPPKTLYKQVEVHEHPHPTDPAVTLRRTTIDEAVKKPATSDRTNQ